MMRLPTSTMSRPRRAWVHVRIVRWSHFFPLETGVGRHLEEAIALLSRLAGPILLVAALGAILWFILHGLG